MDLNTVLFIYHLVGGTFLNELDHCTKEAKPLGDEWAWGREEWWYLHHHLFCSGVSCLEGEFPVLHSQKCLQLSHISGFQLTQNQTTRYTYSGAIRLGTSHVIQMGISPKLLGVV